MLQFHVTKVPILYFVIYKSGECTYGGQAEGVK